MTVKELQEQAFQANLDLVKYNLVVSTWGNVSGYDPELGLMAIKASGVPYEELRPEHMVVMDLDGTVVEGGEFNPSTDTPTHLLLYRNYGPYGVRGVVHTHSTYATVWTQTGRDLPCLGTTHVDYFNGSVPCTRELTKQEIEEAYEANTGLAILEAVKPENCIRIPGVLVNHHAPFVWGTSAKAAVMNGMVLEYVAKMAYLEHTLTGGSCSPLPAAIQKKHQDRKYGEDAYYGQQGR